MTQISAEFPISRNWIFSARAVRAAWRDSSRLFLNSHPHSPLGVRLHGGPHLREGRLLNLPLYAAGMLHRLTLPPNPETL